MELKMKRQIIKIDDSKCNGCGNCVPNCAEGALQIIDGKARLISDLFCDGLGACLGHCPESAIRIEEREAEPYNETRVMAENIVKAGPATIKAHLLHLKDHGQDQFVAEALAYLTANNIPNPLKIEVTQITPAPIQGGCPGSRAMQFNKPKEVAQDSAARPSQLGQWPVQLHLVSPDAPYYRKADLLIASDCSAFAAGDFHNDFLKGKALAIACPKLDKGQEIYVEKITAMIDRAQVNTITVLMMEVPCCGGLFYLVKEALEKATRKVPVKKVILSLQGEVIREEWI
jgi:ferredoxin